MQSLTGYQEELCPKETTDEALAVFASCNVPNEPVPCETVIMKHQVPQDMFNNTQVEAMLCIQLQLKHEAIRQIGKPFQAAVAAVGRILLILQAAMSWPSEHQKQNIMWIWVQGNSPGCKLCKSRQQLLGINLQGESRVVKLTVIHSPVSSCSFCTARKVSPVRTLLRGHADWKVTVTVSLTR